MNCLKGHLTGPLWWIVGGFLFCTSLEAPPFREGGVGEDYLARTPLGPLSDQLGHTFGHRPPKQYIYSV